MNRDELYQSIFKNPTVYRPIQEEESVLLEVAVGCSWRKCAFCDFTKDHFERMPLETIARSCQVLERLGVDGERVYLLGQNPFFMSCGELLDIFALVHRHIPSCKQISMYARADDINRKTPEELAALKAQGLCDLHVGVESGSDTILQMCNKGETTLELLEAFQKLDKAGIGYHVTVILGLGGKPLWKAHAIETSRLLNKLHPRTIWCLALYLFPGTPLQKQAAKGEFEPLTRREALLEERALVENLTVTNCFFMDTTAMGKYTLAAELPDGKPGLLNAINQLLTTGEEDGFFTAPPSTLH